LCEALLIDKCDYILRGHVHKTSLEFKQTPDARALIIAAGACYDTRISKNCYNFVRLDLNKGYGTIYLRVWNNSGAGFWGKDTYTYKKLSHGSFVFPLNEYMTIPLPDGDSLQTIEEQFGRHTSRALRNIVSLIPGLKNTIERDEVSLIDEQLSLGNPIVLTGDAGTGKSAIAAKLTELSNSKDQMNMLIDARNLIHIQSESQLRDYYDLKMPLHAAIREMGRFKKCRLIIDQLDSLVGTTAATILVDLAKECAEYAGVEVVVVSRKREMHEAKLLEKLTIGSFKELTSQLLSTRGAEMVLEQIGILVPSPELTEVGRNLLNLSLIGKIFEQRPDFNFNIFMDEVDLWEHYIQILIDREGEFQGHKNAEMMIYEAIELSKKALNGDDGVFVLDYLPNTQQLRLISWGVIMVEERSGRFYHEKLRDYLYAWDATRRMLMPSAVLDEINIHKTRNVLVWMGKIYKHSNQSLHRQFVKESFNVK